MSVGSEYERTRLLGTPGVPVVYQRHRWLAKFHKDRVQHIQTNRIVLVKRLRTFITTTCITDPQLYTYKKTHYYILDACTRIKQVLF